MSSGDVKQFKRELLAQKEVVKREENLDLLLLMDCTSSMSSWIRESANNLVKIIQTVRQACGFKANIRAAYVGYRDFGDRGDDRHFDVMDYTTDLKAVEDKIKRSRASGGGDAPEDLKGALDVAFNLDHRSPTLCVFLICDAPSHGRQYHDHHDDHPNQPEGSLEAAVRRFSQIKGTECYFTAMQLNNSTNKMFRMMKEAFGNNFLVTDKMVPKDFFSTMFNSMTATIEETRLRFDPSKLLTKDPKSTLETIAEDTPAPIGGKIRIKATSKAPVLPKIRQFEIDDLDYWKNFKDEIESRVLKNQTELVFDPAVIGTGKTSSVFKLYDTKRRVDMVCKIDFRTIEGDADAAYEAA